MQNNISTLYILELESFVLKRAKISTILRRFAQKVKDIDRVAMIHMSRAKLACVQSQNRK